MHALLRSRRAADARRAPAPGAGRAWGTATLLGGLVPVPRSPSLVIALECGIHATVAPLPAGERSRLVIPAWSVDAPAAASGDRWGRALHALVEEVRRGLSTAPAWEVRVTMPLSTGALDASCAAGVAVARALAPTSPATAAAAASEWTRILCDDEGGARLTAASRGGAVYTRRAGSSVLLDPADLILCVAFLGKGDRRPAEGVRRALRADPERAGLLFGVIGVLIGRASRAVQTGDRAALGRVMENHQRVIDELGASSPGIDLLCEVAAQRGAIGATLAGAGESVVAIAPDRVSAARVVTGWRSYGFEGLSTSSVPAGEW